MKEFIKQRVGILLNEARNIGFIYHFTAPINATSIIRENNMKFDSEEYVLSKIKSIGFSTTRNKGFWFIHREIKKPPIVRMTFNGDKISEKFKILPFNAFGELSTRAQQDNGRVESEERVIFNKKNEFKPLEYLVSVDCNIQVILNEEIYKAKDSNLNAQDLKIKIKNNVEFLLQGIAPLKSVCATSGIQFNFISSPELEADQDLNNLINQLKN